MRVLLLDAAFSAEPIYDHLVHVGHEVWVMGARAQDVLAARAGSRWVQHDYSDVDGVRGHLARLGIDVVVPGCTDVSLETCVQIGRPWFRADPAEVNEAISNKAAFRKLCEELDLPAPRAVAHSSFPRSGRFICKPVDAFSGRGITVFDGQDAEAVSHSVSIAEAASRTGEALIEHFHQGDLYSCSAYVEAGRLRFPFFVREGSSVNPFAVDTSYVTYDLPTGAEASLLDGLERLCARLTLADGLLHTQFILDSGQPFIVELTRRCPGDLYARLIEFSTGYPYAANYASAFLEEPLGEARITGRHILRHTVTAQDGGVYRGLSFHKPVNVKAFYPLVPIGVTLLPNQGSRAGVLFVECDDHEALVKSFGAFMDRTACDVT